MGAKNHSGPAPDDRPRVTEPAVRRPPGGARARRQAGPAAAGPTSPAQDGLHALQRMVGNRTVAKLLTHSSPSREVLQRVPPTPLEYPAYFERAMVMLKRHEPVVKAAESPLRHLYRMGRFDTAMSKEDLLRTLKAAAPGLIGQGAATFLEDATADQRHTAWLGKEGSEYEQRLEAEVNEARQKCMMLQPLMDHKQALDQDRASVFGHFNATDENTLWRFTSQPSQEFVYAEDGVSYSKILQIIASHSGGNDKSDPTVKTLSFGRDIAALMGTAASKGGDKHVTNIIDKAAYLFGIDIRSLAKWGISAHPAQGRAISLFETEYVLVATPGDPPRSLSELATRKLENPFRGKAIDSKGWSRAQTMAMKMVVKEMGSVAVEPVPNVEKMTESDARDIANKAKAVQEIASQFAATVRGKDSIVPADMEQLMKTLMAYSAALSKLK